MLGFACRSRDKKIADVSESAPRIGPLCQPLQVFPRRHPPHPISPAPPAMSTTTGDQRWVEMAQLVENMGGELQALADAGGRESQLGGARASDQVVPGGFPRHVPAAGDPGQSSVRRTRARLVHKKKGRTGRAHEQDRFQTVEPEVQAGGGSEGRNVQSLIGQRGERRRRPQLFRRRAELRTPRDSDITYTRACS